MDEDTARTSVKKRLDIADSETAFDDNIDEFVQYAVKRLAPIILEEVDTQNVDVSVDSYGEVVVDLSTLTTPLYSARKVEGSSGGSFDIMDNTYHHGKYLHVTEVPQSTMTLRIYGLKRYTLEDLPDEFHQIVIWFAMSEFYDFLAGNKRKYNIYMGSGARMVENMRDESDIYEQKANDFLNDRAELYGVA